MAAQAVFSRIVQIEQVLDVLLGNPYRDGLAERRIALEAAGVVISAQPRRASESHRWDGTTAVAAWRSWWRELPAPLRDAEPIGVAVAMLLGAEADRDPQRLKELARELDERFRWPCVELVMRSAEVKRAIGRIEGRSDGIRRVREQAWRAAFGERLDRSTGLTEFLRSTPVLILGETGTGKELVAGALKVAMPGTRGENDAVVAAPHETIHLASIPENLVEGALFGHERGSFTGAEERRDGLLRRCHGGAVCLDEVAELPIKTQVALLRALQEGRVLPIGGTKEVEAAPRVLSATHRPIDRLMREDRFREDLFHRLSSVVIRIPPLRERKEDIPSIALREMAAIAQELRPEVKDRFDAFLEKHRDYTWPGNVRELAKVLRALAFGFAPELREPEADGSDGVPSALVAGTMTMKELQAWYAGHVTMRCGENLSATARALDVDRSTLRKHLKGARRGS